MFQILSIVHSTVVHVAVNHGLGKHRSSIRKWEFDAYSKVQQNPHTCYPLGPLVTARSGSIHKPDPRGCDFMSRQMFVVGGFYEPDAFKTCNHRAAFVHFIHRTMGFGSNICTSLPMSETRHLGSHTK